MEKDIDNCGFCDDYPCKELADYHEKIPESKDRLDTINAAYK